MREEKKQKQTRGNIEKWKSWKGELGKENPGKENSWKGELRITLLGTV